MTAFILVPGMFTGAHVWEDTAARLASAGDEVHAVALTGLGGPRLAAADAIDLETHIADVLAVIDSVADAAGRPIVLVGHDYGIHPVLGAADRRAERVGRIVHLDSGLPQDGVPALAAVPDRSLREELAERPVADGAHGELPSPARDAWQRWGSTAGLSDAALDRLTASAAPQPLRTLTQPLRTLTQPLRTLTQPLRTLTQPLRLTGAAASLPVTGVLCDGSGVSIELVQRRVDLGDPAVQALTDPRVTFFELPTGHWPMLSLPAELAEVLLRAAVGEGHRLVPPGPAEPPAHLRPFLLDVPDVPRERTAHVDLYLSDAEGPRPAVVFVHGGPVPAEARPTPRDWPALTGYARCTAGQGAVGVTLDHRLHDVADYPRAAADVAAAVELVRADPRVDGQRIALWFFSGGGLLAADWLRQPPSWLRCLAASYPVLAPLPFLGPIGARFHPADALPKAGALPLVITRVGREGPETAATVEEFLTASRNCGAAVEVIDVPNGHHAFETIDLTQESRDAVHRAMCSVLAHLAV
ncbi:alpha/beta hydrolase [Streptomyces laculatispora]|uniref:alpha/beta hydrolase n=1 Tax=Streptomyces laculatispora TaxID=887464 RepID=UPI001A94DB64|nr:alpha/beta hydrolase [Streptomyces laculatispora]MBO0915451.1 alpha/beta hydrolase [Streptomyces laculatispora]